MCFIANRFPICLVQHCETFHRVVAALRRRRLPRHCVGANLIVHELDVGPVDLLALVLGLLHLEDMLVEVLLQLLVRQVDAELLEVVLFELLEACVQVEVVAS